MIKIGIDGCGIPVFAVPLKNMAIAFMKLACPDTLDDKNMKTALNRLQNAINTNSVMIRGTNFVCDVFNRDSNIIAKGGAQGVYCFGMKKEKTGVALKLEDGPEKFWPIMVCEILKQLKYGNTETIDNIKSISQSNILNDNKEIIGKVQAIFKL